MVIHVGSNGKESALNSGDRNREDPLEKEMAFNCLLGIINLYYLKKSEKKC